MSPSQIGQSLSFQIRKLLLITFSGQEPPKVLNVAGEQAILESFSTKVDQCFARYAWNITKESRGARARLQYAENMQKLITIEITAKILW